MSSSFDRDIFFFFSFLFVFFCFFFLELIDFVDVMTTADFQLEYLHFVEVLFLLFVEIVDF